MLECDVAASCLYVNEPKVKVDLTKYNERHTFRQGSQAQGRQLGPAVTAGWRGKHPSGPACKTWLVCSMLWRFKSLGG